MCWHTHNRTGTVAEQHIIGNPDRHRFSVQLVDYIAPQEDAGLLPLHSCPLDFSLPLRFKNILLHLSLMLLCSKQWHQRMLRRQNKEGHPEDSIRAGSKYSYLLGINALMLQTEGNLSADTFANPIRLHYLYALRPVYLAEVQKLIGILGNSEEPLLQHLLEHRCTAALTRALTNYLFISQHRLTFGTPVDRRLGPISQTSFIKLEEKPLRPFIVFGKAGDNLTVPIIYSPDALKLAAHILYIFHRPNIGMNPMIDSCVLRRQPESIKAHRMEHVIALHPLEPGMDIRGRHGIPVPDMEVTRGIGEHGQGIELRATVTLLDLVKSVNCPFLLPLLFDFMRVIF